MNSLYAEEVEGHHRMRNHVLTVLHDADVDVKLPGTNPTLGGVLIELGTIQGVYTHSLKTFTLDWHYRQLPAPATVTIESLQQWFAKQDSAMKTALDRFTEEELREERIDRGGGFVASAFVQHEIYREAVYIIFGRLSVYLRALEREAGPEWAAWVG